MRRGCGWEEGGEVEVLWGKGVRMCVRGCAVTRDSYAWVDQPTCTSTSKMYRKSNCAAYFSPISILGCEYAMREVSLNKQQAV